MKRPAHGTIVAYVALFIALGTGVAFAATKITSSRQIDKGVVKSSDVKDATLGGKDVRDGGLGAADIGVGAIDSGRIEDGAVTGADLANATLGTNQIADGSLRGADIGGDSIAGAQIDEGSLELARGFSNFQGGIEPIDNGGAFSVPRSPEGDVVLLALAPGRYFLNAHAFLSADDNGAGVYCLLLTPSGSVEAGNDVGSLNYGGSDSTPAQVTASAITESETNFLVRLSCADDGSGASANDRGIEAVELRD